MSPASEQFKNFISSFERLSSNSDHSSGSCSQSESFLRPSCHLSRGRVGHPTCFRDPVRHDHCKPFEPFLYLCSGIPMKPSLFVGLLGTSGATRDGISVSCTNSLMCLQAFGASSIWQRLQDCNSLLHCASDKLPLKHRKYERNFICSSGTITGTPGNDNLCGNRLSIFYNRIIFSYNCKSLLHIPI